MSMAFYLSCVTVSVTILVACFLSNWMVVGPWGCFISSGLVRSGTALCVLMYPDPVSDYLAEDMTALTTLLLTIIV